MLTQEMLDAWLDQYNVLFRNTSDGVITLDPTGLLTRMNPAAAAMLRIAPDECVGKKPAEIFRDMPVLVDLLLGQGQAVRKVVLQSKRVALVIAEPSKDSGRLVLLHDITEREELDSRREQLIAAIGHDLRNPISAIYGFAELVEMYGPLTPDQKRFVTRIAQTSQKMQSLVYTLVDLAWVESGMPLENVPVDLDIVIRQAVSELGQEAKEKRIPIAISTQQPMPVVMGDTMRLKQVVYNLLHNAILYSGPEQPVAIHAYAQDQHVRCTVADRGIGIAESEIDQVFDRTYRSPNEAVRSVPGGGIGLTMARVILKRHGGAIEASSVLGRGSTFMFTLPLAEQPGR